MNLLNIRAKNPTKYALSLMDAIFSDEELATKCFSVALGVHYTDCIDRREWNLCNQ